MYVLWVMSSFLVWCCCLDAKEASLALFPKNDMLSISTFFERMKPMVDKYQGSFPFSFIPYFTHTHFLAPVKSPTPNSTVTKFHSHNSQKHVGEICSDTTLPNTPPYLPIEYLLPFRFPRGVYFGQHIYQSLTVHPLIPGSRNSVKASSNNFFSTSSLLIQSSI